MGVKAQWSGSRGLTATVKGPTIMTRPDWNQTDPAKADFILNKPEVITSTPQDLTEAQQAQARKNIGAMQNGVADSDLDMADHVVDNVEAIHFVHVFDGEKTGGAYVSCYNDIYDEDGKIVCGCLEFAQDEHDVPVVLRRLYPGIEDHDAATVGQLKAAKSEILEQILAELPDGDEVSY